MRTMLLVGIVAAAGVVGCKHHHVNDAPQLAVTGLKVSGDNVEGDIVNESATSTERFVVANFAVYDAAGLRVGTASAVTEDLIPGATYHFTAPIIAANPMPAGAGPATTAEITSLGGG